MASQSTADTQKDVPTLPVPQIETRLADLNELDTKIATIVSAVSSSLSHLVELKKTANAVMPDEMQRHQSARNSFQESNKQFFETVEEVGVKLRREIRVLDGAIGGRVKVNTQSGDAQQRNGGEETLLLPININRKAVWVGEYKKKQQLKVLDEMLNSDTEIRKDEEVKENTDKDGDIIM